jgi:hypothetical protein
MVFCGYSAQGRHGEICPIDLALGRPYTITIGIGETMGPSIEWFKSYKSASIEKAKSIGICGVSMAHRFGLPDPRRGL